MPNFIVNKVLFLILVGGRREDRCIICLGPTEKIWDHRDLFILFLPGGLNSTKGQRPERFDYKLIWVKLCSLVLLWSKGVYEMLSKSNGPITLIKLKTIKSQRPKSSWVNCSNIARDIVMLKIFKIIYREKCRVNEYGFLLISYQNTTSKGNIHLRKKL